MNNLASSVFNDIAYFCLPLRFFQKYESSISIENVLCKSGSKSRGGSEEEN